jgi:hypothetical protein
MPRKSITSPSAAAAADEVSMRELDELAFDFTGDDAMDLGEDGEMIGEYKDGSNYGKENDREGEEEGVEGDEEMEEDGDLEEGTETVNDSIDIDNDTMMNLDDEEEVSKDKSGKATGRKSVGKNRGRGGKRVSTSGEVTGDGEEGASKGRRGNAKPIECLDLEGNLIHLYGSGTEASRALNIAQADISQCCRGKKDHVNGMRFRFQGDTTDYAAEQQATAAAAMVLGGRRPKRGYQYVMDGANEEKQEDMSNYTTTRTTRQSLSGPGRPPNENSLKFYLPPKEDKAREWSMGEVSIGPFMIKKWIPKTPTLNPALQEFKAKVESVEAGRVKTTRAYSRRR